MKLINIVLIHRPPEHVFYSYYGYEGYWLRLSTPTPQTTTVSFDINLAAMKSCY